MKVSRGMAHVELQEHVLSGPVVIFEALLAALQRMGAQVEKLRDSWDRQRLAPEAKARAALCRKDDLVCPVRMTMQSPSSLQQ